MVRKRKLEESTRERLHGLVREGLGKEGKIEQRPEEVRN